MWEVKLPSPGIPAFEKRDELFQPRAPAVHLRWVHDGWFLEGFLTTSFRHLVGWVFFKPLGVGLGHTRDWFFSVVIEKKEIYDFHARRRCWFFDAFQFELQVRWGFALGYQNSPLKFASRIPHGYLNLTMCDLGCIETKAGLLLRCTDNEMNRKSIRINSNQLVV